MTERTGEQAGLYANLDVGYSEQIGADGTPGKLVRIPFEQHAAVRNGTETQSAALSARFDGTARHAGQTVDALAAVEVQLIRQRP